MTPDLPPTASPPSTPEPEPLAVQVLGGRLGGGPDEQRRDALGVAGALLPGEVGRDEPGSTTPTVAERSAANPRATASAAASRRRTRPSPTATRGRRRPTGRRLARRRRGAGPPPRSSRRRRGRWSASCRRSRRSSSRRSGSRPARRGRRPRSRTPRLSGRPLGRPSRRTAPSRIRRARRRGRPTRCRRPRSPLSFAFVSAPVLVSALVSAPRLSDQPRRRRVGDGDDAPSSTNASATARPIPARCAGDRDRGLHMAIGWVVANLGVPTRGASRPIRLGRHFPSPPAPSPQFPPISSQPSGRYLYRRRPYDRAWTWPRTSTPWPASPSS